ncbi:hypothetical protein SAMN05216388_101697 [Halorientalis persicus]|uniref:Uncharacterized protein n=1 Tax=Halorientalis persicus TaxID=1367881 RepID=A0A1H8RKJ9_9EURY|nr:hypothetical protein [Halorientalis persicus]SEO66876.1 hypothetical protein SAMN05216388_101697 [Halorientalis persicus]
MSVTTTQSDGYAPESQRFVDWSNFKENRWKYVGETQPVPEPNIWTPDHSNATVIRYDKDCQQDPKKRKKFKRLSEYNSGLRNGKWTNQDYNTYLLNEHLIWSLITQLDLNPRYQQKAAGLFHSFNLQKFGVSANIVAYCTCAVVVHQADNERNCHPWSKNRDSEFEKIASCEGYQEKELISIYNKISQTPEKYQG